MGDWTAVVSQSYLGLAHRIDGILHWAEQELGSHKAGPGCRFRAYKEPLLRVGNLDYPSTHPTPPGSREQHLLVEALFQVRALTNAVAVLMSAPPHVARRKFDIVLAGEPLADDKTASWAPDTEGRVARDNLAEFTAARILRARAPTAITEDEEDILARVEGLPDLVGEVHRPKSARSFPGGVAAKVNQLKEKRRCDGKTRIGAVILATEQLIRPPRQVFAVPTDLPGLHIFDTEAAFDTWVATVYEEQMNELLASGLKLTFEIPLVFLQLTAMAFVDGRPHGIEHLVYPKNRTVQTHLNPASQAWLDRLGNGEPTGARLGF